MLTTIPPELDVPQRPGSILDVGCGLQPQALWPPTSEGPFSVGVDAHLPYLEKLRDDGHDGILVHATWDELFGLLVDDSFDVVVALDFIEHLQRGEGKQFLKHAKRVGRSVVIYTPDGKCDQTEDVWNLGGEDWQTHRSAWKARDFGKGWQTLAVEGGHEEDGVPKAHKALWAVWG